MAHGHKKINSPRPKRIPKTTLNHHKTPLLLSWFLFIKNQLSFQSRSFLMKCFREKRMMVRVKTSEGVEGEGAGT